MDYYIFRHGATFHSEKNIDYGDEQYSATLLPEGVDAIKRLGEYLKDIQTGYNVSSPFLRVSQTVEVVKEITDKEFVVDERLGELLWEKDDNNENYPYLETIDDLKVRVQRFLDDLKSKNYNSVCIATHGGVIAALKNLILKGEFEEKAICKKCILQLTIKIKHL